MQPGIGLSWSTSGLVFRSTTRKVKISRGAFRVGQCFKTLLVTLLVMLMAVRSRVYVTLKPFFCGIRQADLSANSQPIEEQPKEVIEQGEPSG